MTLTPRRALLAGAGSTVAASLLLAGSDAPHDPTAPTSLASVGDELGLNIVTDPRWANGAVGDGATDCTAAVQAADTVHTLAFGTGNVVADQPFVSVVLSRPPTTESVVQLTARTKAAAAAAAWVQPTPQGYQVFLANPPTAPTPAATFAYSVLVTGIADASTTQI